jgi:terminase large subunit-like protein
MNSDMQLLLAAGAALDARPARLRGSSHVELLIERLIRIRDRNGRPVPLELNRAQRELARDSSRRKIVLKARQMGITTYVAARFFIATITRPGTLTVQVAHDQQAAEEIFKIVHRFQENLPAALHAAGAGECAFLRTSRSNVRQIVFPEIDSEYRVETAADPNAGRGLTIQNLHCSEVARWPRHAAETLAALRAAVPASGEIVLESTPNGAAGCFYDEWQRAHETGYSAHFFPWWYEPAYAQEGDPYPLTNEEIELAQRFGLSSRQICYRRHLQASYRGLAPQEFCEDAASCFLASGECVFDLEALQQRLEHSSQLYSESRENGALLVWYPPAGKREYIIGVDPAGGGAEGDYACAQVLDRATGLQCAELRAHLTPFELAARLDALAAEYNHALLVIERNNHGHAVLAHLAASASNANIYEQRGQTGWLTTAANRPQMIANLCAVLAAQPRLFSSSRFLEECRTFVRHSNGTAAAMAGAHDDLVMAMAIALQARNELLAAVRPTPVGVQSSCV